MGFAPMGTIRGTLFVLIAIVFTPVVVLAAVEVIDEYRDRRDAEVEASAELARTVARSFEGFVASVAGMEHALAVSFATRGPELRQIRDELANVLPEYPAIVDMSWSDPQGNVLTSTEPQLVGKSLFARDYFQEITAGASWRVSPLIHSLADGRPVFVVARGSWRGGALVGVVTAAVDAERLDALLVERSGEGRVSVVDSAGTLVAIRPATASLDWDRRRNTSGDRSVLRALRGEESLGVFRSPLTGERRVGAVVPIRSLGWAAHASRPAAEAFGPVREGVARNAAAILVFALAALGAALVVARRIAEPLRGLEQHAAALARDGSAPVQARGPAEVKRVARALESMATRLADRRTEAERHGAELEALVAALPVGLAVVDADGRPVRVNDAARALFGLADDEVSSPLRVSGADGAPVAERDQPHRRALRGELVREEILRLDHGGRDLRWIAASAAPIRDAGGAIRGAVETVVDITHVRELQEERETLMQMVSHDLRTPLHVIVGHAQILRRRGDEDATRRADAILGSAGRMTRLIGDLVDAARLEAGHLALRREPVDLASFLAGWRDRMAGALAMHRVRLAAPPAAAVVLADPARLDQILANLVSNALKYSVAESEVHVTLRAEDRALRLSVEDHGHGITPEELPRLFERYYRAESAARAEGLGLGLFITRKLVEAHGWRIEVESELGKGSVFTIVVPVAHDRPSAARSAPPSSSVA